MLLYLNAFIRRQKMEEEILLFSDEKLQIIDNEINTFCNQHRIKNQNKLFEKNEQLLELITKCLKSDDEETAASNLENLKNLFFYIPITIISKY
jgi:hypothetical protein